MMAKKWILMLLFSAGIISACPVSPRINNISMNAGGFWAAQSGLKVFLEREISYTRRWSNYRAFSVHYDGYKSFQSAGIKVNMFNLIDMLDCRNVGKILSPCISTGSLQFEGNKSWFVNAGADLRIFTVSPDNYTFYRLNISYQRSLVKSPVLNYFACTLGIALNTKGLKPRRGNRSTGGMNF